MGRPTVGAAAPCRPPRHQPTVGAAVPCRPPRPQPTVGAAVPCGPPCPQPSGRGGSPLPPAAHPDREAVSLKTCSLVFVSGTCGAQGETLVEPFVAPRSFFYILYIFYTVKFISRRDTQSHAERPPPSTFSTFPTRLNSSPRSPRSPRPIPCGRQGTAAPTVGRPTPPPFYILYISYTVKIPPRRPPDA